MNPGESLAVFENFARARGLDLRASTPREGLAAMLAFRAAIACPDCADDMLLYQWGSYDWGAGRYFELDISRQFIESALEDDDAISQLSLTYKYQPNAQLEALGEGNCWEQDSPDFHELIFSSAAFMAVADLQADQLALSYEPM